MLQGVQQQSHSEYRGGSIKDKESRQRESSNSNPSIISTCLLARFELQAAGECLQRLPASSFGAKQGGEAMKS